MKSYEEMARYVLEVRDGYEKKKRRRAGVLRICVPVAAGLCAVLLIGVGIWKNMPAPDKIPSAEHIITTETVPSGTTSVRPAAEKPVTSFTAAVSAVTSAASSTVTETVSVTEKQSGTSRIATAAVTAAQTKATTALTHTRAPDLVQTTTINAAETTVTGGNMGIPVTNTTTVSGGDMGIPSTRTTTASPVITAQQWVTTGTQTVTTGIHQNPGGGTIPWIWESVEHQYDTAELDGFEGSYKTAYAINPKYDYISEAIARAVMTGYDSENNEAHTCEATAYHVKGLDDNDAVAIKFSSNNNYYLYCRDYMNINELMDRIRSINQ